MEPNAEQRIEIEARAIELLKRHGGKAYGRARMQLYEALHRQDTAEVQCLTHVCLMLNPPHASQQSCCLKNGRILDTEPTPDSMNAATALSRWRLSTFQSRYQRLANVR